jgi:hypothetical protein
MQQCISPSVSGNVDASDFSSQTFAPIWSIEVLLSLNPFLWQKGGIDEESRNWAGILEQEFYFSVFKLSVAW